MSQKIKYTYIWKHTFLLFSLQGILEITMGLEKGKIEVKELIL